MDEAAAVDALTRLGLTTYEARAFVALQKLGTGTASEVSEHADVPRSQVYGAADGLAERGLVEVQQTTPTRYRPVPLEQARTKLLRDLEAEGERAFDYLSSVAGSAAEDERRSEAVWTVTDAAAIDARVAELVEAAETRVLYGASRLDQVNARVLEALGERAAAGVDVAVASEDPDVRERAGATDGVETIAPTEEGPGNGRVLLADSEGILLSVVGGDHLPRGEGETAIWSADTAFAAVIVTLLEEWAGAHLPVDPSQHSGD